MKTKVEENSEIEKLTITSSEWHALNLIRGLEQEAHYMVIAATERADGQYDLEGRTKVFGTLAQDVFEEIYSNLSPAKQLKQLAKLYKKLEPETDY
jgi:hypothetical protein